MCIWILGMSPSLVHFKDLYLGRQNKINTYSELWTLFCPLVPCDFAQTVISKRDFIEVKNYEVLKQISVSCYYICRDSSCLAASHVRNKL